MYNLGIITMHRVNNVGSVLQAYALQEYIKKIGYRVQIIDYQYPNSEHLKKLNIQTDRTPFYKNAIIKILKIFVGDNSKKIKKFLYKYLNLSCYYPNYKSLIDNPPIYDIYCTGSDQVWNPRFCCNDGAFFLDFINNGKKISFGSSISVLNFDTDYNDFLKEKLSSYKSIGVREVSSVEYLSQLLQKDIFFNCDPTLLLSISEWNKIVKQKPIIKRKYILFYILTYSYNPYPKVQNLIDKLVSQTGLYPVFLYGGYRQLFKKGKCIQDAGPSEFMNLIRNAEIVVTSSFHGTCFSLIFNKQFYSLVKSENDKNDERIQSLLKKIECSDRLLYDDKDYYISDISYINYEKINKNISDYVQPSKEYLKQAIREEL